MIEPDEIFLDSKNLQGFDQQQFEGRIEKPIRKRTTLFLGFFFIIFVLIFIGQLLSLQIRKGKEYLKRSENNTLSSVIIFADRGIIYDRSGIELAWNKKTEDLSLSEEERILLETFPLRSYLSPGFAHILGYVSSPTKDKSGKYWQTDYIGKDGLEKQYDEKIKGINGSKIIEIDAHGVVHSENIQNAPTRGKDLATTIDSKIQSKLFSLIEDLSKRNSFTGGAGILLDVTNGEIIISTSYPEYDANVLSLGKDEEKINGYLSDKRKVFLDRTISGLYTPGSIVKPFFALGALAEEIISPYKEILSTGSISIPNPYFPDQPSVFRDWKAHGWTDMSEAIAVSSDVYFYSIGGGFEGQKGLGISNLEKYARMFGLGEETGVDLPDEKFGTIPSPEWKLKTFAGDPWRVGDTYNTAIGQYGFQVTLLEMARAVSAIGNRGILVTPHFVLEDKVMEEKISKINLSSEYYNEVYLGMREAVEYGTAIALNVPYVEVAAKTGTAQVGTAKNKVNSWIIGFFPYENPRYAFTVMMESGPSQGESGGASSVMRGLFDWMYWNTPEYFGLPPWPKKEEVIEEENNIETEEIIDTFEENLDLFMLENE